MGTQSERKAAAELEPRFVLLIQPGLAVNIAAVTGAQGGADQVAQAASGPAVAEPVVETERGSSFGAFVDGRQDLFSVSLGIDQALEHHHDGGIAQGRGLAIAVRHGLRVDFLAAEVDGSDQCGI